MDDIKKLKQVRQHGSFTDGAACMVAVLSYFGLEKASPELEFSLFEEYGSHAFSGMLPSGIAAGLAAYEELDVRVYMNQKVIHNKGFYGYETHHQMVLEEEAAYVNNKEIQLIRSACIDDDFMREELTSRRILILLTQEQNIWTNPYYRDLLETRYTDKREKPRWVVIFDDSRIGRFDVCDPAGLMGKHMDRSEVEDIADTALGKVCISIGRKPDPENVYDDVFRESRELKKRILKDLKRTDGRVSKDFIVNNYSLDEAEAERILDELVRDGFLLQGNFGYKWFTCKKSDFVDYCTYYLAEITEKRPTNIALPDYELLYCIRGQYNHHNMRRLVERLENVNALVLSPEHLWAGRYTTYLLEAIHSGNPEAVRCLLDAGADPNFIDEHLDPDENPLASALFYSGETDKDIKRFCMISLLLMAGADPRNAPYCEGETSVYQEVEAKASMEEDDAMCETERIYYRTILKLFSASEEHQIDEESIYDLISENLYQLFYLTEDE